jgi:hypothetical protein
MDAGAGEIRIDVRSALKFYVVLFFRDRNDRPERASAEFATTCCAGRTGAGGWRIPADPPASRIASDRTPVRGRREGDLSDRLNRASGCRSGRIRLAGLAAPYKRLNV